MTLKKNILLVLAIAWLLLPLTTQATTMINTLNGVVTYISGGISADQRSATVTVLNNTDLSGTLYLASYQIYVAAPDKGLDSQQLYNQTSVNIAAHSQATLNVSLPNCRSQVDLETMPAPQTIPGGSPGFLGAWYSTLAPCGYNPPPPPPPVQTLNGSCTVNPASANIGDSIAWSTTGVSGGTGSYTYSWTGSDGFSAGNVPSTYQTYSSAGTKIATVTITSGSQSITRSCSTVINQPQIVNTLKVTCSVNPSNVNTGDYINWSANASNGTNNYYTYSWSGTDGLYGNSSYTSQYYNNSGTKTATVTVTSGGQTATASCSANVHNYNNQNLDVSCYASPSNANVGDRVRWYADISGDDGNADYNWYGTDGLNSSSQSPSITYNYPGSKSATIQVYDNGHNVSATCYTNINQNSVLAFSQANPTPLPNAVYLSQVPYTGLADNLNLIWFILGLAAFSAYIAYVIISHKKEVGELN